MKTGLSMHAAIALVSVALAYTAWTSPAGGSQSAQRGLQVLAGNNGELTAIDWSEGEQQKTRVSLRQDAGKISVRVEREQKEGEPTVSEFPGSDRAEELFEKLRTIEASRSLGMLDTAKRDELALGEAGNKRLVLRFGERTVNVNVGNETYGTRNYYVSGPSSEVFLVDSALLSSLRHGAGVLLDRRAVGIDKKDVKRVIVKRSGGQARELVHRYPEEDQAFYADAAEPDTKVEEAEQWFTRVLNQRVKTLDPERRPTEPAALRVEFVGEPEGFIEFWAPGSEKTALIRSSRFEGFATINGVAAKRLIEDAQIFFSPSSKKP